MKGALWSLDISSFGKYAISGLFFIDVIIYIVLELYLEPTLATDLLTKLLACQSNEKVRTKNSFPIIELRIDHLFQTSIQSCVSTVFDNCAPDFPKLVVSISRNEHIHAFQASGLSLNQTVWFTTSPLQPCIKFWQNSRPV